MQYDIKTLNKEVCISMKSYSNSSQRTGLGIG